MSGAVLWTSEQAAVACHGRATRAWTATGVSIDSRTLQPGELFVAIRGPTFDGHDFVADALARGAAAAVIARMPTGVSIDAPLLLVEDTLLALWALGRAARERSTASIVAVTGSVGKTSVKQALHTVLSRQGPAYATVGSLNNHWGVPLSLARLPAKDRYGIFELGMNHAGEIAPLSRLVRPNVAVITTVAEVHIENFASIEAIAEAKAEIFAGMVTGGTAVLNRDSPFFDRFATAARSGGGGASLGFGRDPRAEVRLLTAEIGENGSVVCADVCGRRCNFRVGTAGEHAVINALCVLAAVVALGADVDAAAASFADVTPMKGRGQRHRIAIDGGTFTLIDDSYNASPVSMAAAFAVLGAQRPQGAGRRIVALGDMLELGSEAARLHAGLALPIDANGIDLVFACGTNMAELYSVLAGSRRGAFAADAASLAPLVAEAVRPGDVVTVKGSAGSRMRLVVEALQSLGSPFPASSPPQRMDPE